MNKNIIGINGNIKLLENEVEINITSRTEKVSFREIKKVLYNETENNAGTLDIYTKNKGNMRIKFNQEKNIEFKEAFEYIKQAQNKQKPETKKTGLIVIAVAIAVMICAGFIFLICGDSTPQNNIQYKIVKEDDVSFGTVVRKSLHAVIPVGDYTEDEIKILLKHIAKKYISTNKVNALAVFLYDDENDVGEGYTIAMCDYAPNGNWSNARNVNTGDYKKFKYDFKFR